ncbi:lytic enzyme [Undibacterium sp. CCC2.1]|nr:lytic enzyme [Undibacterium sp. CCC3.4]MEB0140179.1 lytic enzyme [Undibacterium sp. CCC2.1]MEB0172447.1 lytic enzyme [Undibacterium sp. CCC1.1]MEB0176965.1 lytic enzyme [Undibacterium sp. CCC3.4]MEB0215569.1 lytic enzyme [Undibacterium sp. 5I2]
MKEHTMTIVIDPKRILRYANRPRPSYVSSLAQAQAMYDRYGISANALRAAHFTAQIMYESQALRAEQENLNYSANRLAAVWPSRFQPRGPLNPADYAHQPQALADYVYGNKNGNTEADDGYRFRGRGLLQLTFKSNYAAATRALQKLKPMAPDLCLNPDAVTEPDWALAVAAAVWEAKGCNGYADHDNINKVTRAINGGENGLAERKIWLRMMKQLFGV